MENQAQKINSVVAAVAFDKYTENVLSSAQTFCQQTGAALHLVHICEPDASLAYFMPYYDDGRFADAEQRYLDRASEAAEKRLLQLVHKLDGRIKATHAIVQGIPSEALEKEAKRVAADLIIIGVGLSQVRFMPRGWSTALTMMAESTHPVMLVDKESTLQFAPTGINVLLADDLQSDGQKLCRFTAKVASAIKAEKLFHLHTTGFQKDTLAAALESAFAAGHAGTSKSLDADEVLAVIQTKIAEKLQARMRPFKGQLDDFGVIYDTVLTSGDPRDAINEQADAVHASVVVYGRHKALHRRPFTIGQVPFSAMVRQKRPVIVVPTTE